MFNQVKDSGTREEFATGSKRDSQDGKGRFDLLPFIALRRLAVHYENGSKKYGDHNWRKGQPLSRYFSSAMRHMIRWMLGWKDEDHLSAAVWNLCSIIETEEMIRRGKLPSELDDRLEELQDDYQFEQGESIEPQQVQSSAGKKTIDLHLPENKVFGQKILKYNAHVPPSGEQYKGILYPVIASGTLVDLPISRYDDSRDKRDEEEWTPSYRLKD